METARRSKERRSAVLRGQCPASAGLSFGGECFRYLAAGYVFLCNILEQPKAHASSQLPLGFLNLSEDPARGTHLWGEGPSSPRFPECSVNHSHPLCLLQTTTAKAASLLPGGRANKTPSCPQWVWDRAAVLTASGIYCIASHSSLLC